MDGMKETTDEKILERAKERFELARDSWSDQRTKALDDIRFARLGEQWPEEWQKKREAEGRPCLTINRIPSFIRQVVNDARINKPSIEVHPADDNSDPETAEIFSGLIRNIEYTSDAEVAYDSSLNDAVTCGWGFFRIDLEYAQQDSFDLDLAIRRIANPLSVYFDPFSTAADSSDWEWCHITEMRSKEDFENEFPDEHLSDWEGDYDETWLTDDEIRVCEYWEKSEQDSILVQLSDGTTCDIEHYQQHPVLQTLEIVRQRPWKRPMVMQYLMVRDKILDRKSWPGIYIPVIPVYGEEVVEEGKRHFISLARQAKDAQLNYNVWRSAATELVGLSPKVPFIGPVGAYDTDRRKWETINTSAHPFVEYDGDIPPQRMPLDGGPAAGAMQEALSANDDMKSIMGLFDASLGQRSNETSGRAILARQREGDVSTFHYIDNLSRAIRHAGRVLIDMIPKVYSTPRVLRVMGYDEQVEIVPVNQEFQKGGLVKMHDLTAGKYDLTVSQGPSFTTQREESREAMLQMMQANPQVSALIGDLYAKAQDWPGADDIAKRLKAMLPPQILEMEAQDGLPPEAQAAVAQANQQVQQLQQQLEQGMQMFQQMQQQMTEMNLKLQDRSQQNELKRQEIETRERVEMAKLENARNLTMSQEMEETRRMVIDNSMEIVAEQIAKQAEAAQMRLDGLFPDLIGEITQVLNAPKTMRIQAPSGQTYEGRVENGQVQVVTPSGDVYEGQVH